MGQGRHATAARRAAPLTAALISLVLGGCSGTTFGDRLAGSFSAAPATPPATPASAPASAPAKPASPTPSGGTQPARPAPAAPTKAATKPAATVAMEPAPYRITIKLPSGDPSAPAEVVTQALRAAGVAFEVEMIERVGATAPAAAPQPVPAPRPR